MRRSRFVQTFREHVDLSIIRIASHLGTDPLWQRHLDIETFEFHFRDHNASQNALVNVYLSRETVIRNVVARLCEDETATVICNQLLGVVFGNFILELSSPLSPSL